MKQGWEYKKLGECFPYIKNGANIKQIKDADGYPITRIETLSGGVFNRDRMGYAGIYDLNKYKDYVLEDGDLLMSHINSKTYIGRTVEYKKEGDETIIHGMNLLRLKSNNSYIVPSFMAYYTLSAEFKANVARVRKDAVNQSSMAISDLKKFLIPLPPLSTQQSIVAELDEINNLLSLKRKELETYDKLAQSLFYEMFGDPVENEKGWKVKKIEDCAEHNKNALKAGPFGSSLKKEFYVPSGYKIYGQEQVIANDSRYGDYYIDKRKYEELKSCAVKAGDVLISLVGTFGKLLIIPNVFEEGIINPRLVKISFDKEIIDVIYFKYFFTSDSLRLELENKSHGQTMGILNLGIIREMSIPLPPLPLQQTFAKKIEAIEKQKDTVSRQIKDLETLLASRMQYWFE